MLKPVCRVWVLLGYIFDDFGGSEGPGAHSLDFGRLREPSAKVVEKHSIFMNLVAQGGHFRGYFGAWSHPGAPKSEPWDPGSQPMRFRRDFKGLLPAIWGHTFS